MRAWSSPEIPSLVERGPEVSIYDTSQGEVVLTDPGETARLYVCGITPYDATHLGHANTYLTFDLLNRAWRSAGHQVRYVQNVTDVDDPLLERANRDGVDWRELAERETELFRTDMTALRVLPPDHYVGVVESIELIAGEVQRLRDAGTTYDVDGDIYHQVVASMTGDHGLGRVSGMDRDQMTELFAERGGDPQRPGKQDPLDALLWRAQRPGEPAWETPVGTGRPGWHVECSAIARSLLGPDFDIQGGGSDLVFPHHEMSAAHVVDAYPGERFARGYVHAGMVGYDGEKMSKSRGNLVLVSQLRAAGKDPMAIRLALLAEHYRGDWEWHDQRLDDAEARLARWREAVEVSAAGAAAPVVTEVLAALADDLDAPRALAAVDAWAASGERAGGDVVRALVDAALGVAL